VLTALLCNGNGNGKWKLPVNVSEYKNNVIAYYVVFVFRNIDRKLPLIAIMLDAL